MTANGVSVAVWQHSLIIDPTVKTGTTCSHVVERLTVFRVDTSREVQLTAANLDQSIRTPCEEATVIHTVLSPHQVHPRTDRIMGLLDNLLENNRNWARGAKMVEPEYFQKLSNQQSPKYLWIGCADSRVPANQITGLSPGEVFVHRNIANIVVHSDFNCLSVIEYAVHYLKVEHIIVCGHYGCGGVQASLQNNKLGLIDNWLRHLRDIRQMHDDVLSKIDDPDERVKLLCEFNVIEQVQHVCQTTIVQDAWDRGHKLAVHGWIYSLADGLLNDLNACVQSAAEVSSIYRLALTKSKDTCIDIPTIDPSERFGGGK